MNIAARLFLGYFLIAVLGTWFVFNIFAEQIKPGIRQASEEVLIDSANVLAELAAQDLANGRINNGTFTAALQAARARRPQAEIFDVSKNNIDLRIYITDARGRVVYDSQGLALGRDYSNWRDVALTLRGQYGARSTRDKPALPNTSVMYVAAPIIWQNELIGVLSLAKPTTGMLPYIARNTEHVKRAGLILLAVSIAIGLISSSWLAWNINRLRAYARAIRAGKKAKIPGSGGQQLSELALTLADLREQIEGKKYVEKYVKNLAHEMKSPLTAVIGAAELLAEEPQPPAAERQRFIASIQQQSQRLQRIIERMLLLAKVEKLQSPADLSAINVQQLAERCLAERQSALLARQLSSQSSIAAHCPKHIQGDAFLIQQALLNLLDNAIDFSPIGGLIKVNIFTDETFITISVEDEGEGAPDYATQQLFEPFYSLPHPATQRKSTGLGLPFVREVARLHGGDAHFSNLAKGAKVTLQIAFAPQT